jgi:phage/plasmid-like protein (TIGR03299 family)
MMNTQAASILNNPRTSAMRIIGEDVEGALNASEALSRAPKADFTVETRPLYTAQGDPIPNNFGIYRTDRDREVDGFLGSAKQKYTPVQTIDALSIGDAVVSSDVEGRAHYEYVGALGKGEKVVALINLGGFDPVPGDPHDAYLAMCVRHDGNASNTYRLLVLRGRCQNSLPAVFHTNSGSTVAEYKIRHTRNALERMKEGRRILERTSRSISSIKEKLEALASRELRRDNVVTILDRLFPKPVETENVPESSLTRIENRRSAFLELFERNDGPNGLEIIRGTAYNALNAYTEFIDHEVSVVKTSAKDGYSYEEIRADRALFGTGSVEKQNALDLILDATRFAPRRAIEPVYSMPSNNILDSILDQTQNRLAA